MKPEKSSSPCLRNERKMAKGHGWDGKKKIPGDLVKWKSPESQHVPSISLLYLELQKITPGEVRVSSMD